MSWVVVLGILLMVSSAVTNLPQLFRTLKKGDLAGISFTTQLAWTISWMLWVRHSVEIGALPKVAADSIGLVSDCILLCALMFFLKKSSILGETLKGSAWVLIPIPFIYLAFLWGGPVALAVTLTIYDGVSLAPQLWRSYRSSSLAGLSLVSWVLRCFVAAGWIIYAFGIGAPEAAGWTFIMFPAAVWMSIKILQDRHKVVVIPAQRIVPKDDELSIATSEVTSAK